MDPVAGLAGGVRRLEAMIRDQLKVSGKNVLFDLAVLDFATQVVEAAKATLLLHFTEAPRVSWATARQGFEATHDLFYLLELSPDRLEAGAKVYVGALHAIAVSRSKLATAAVAAALDSPDEASQPGLREFVRQEAAEIERLSPGSEAAILSVLDERFKGGERHWSGLPRKQMIKRIRELPNDDGLGAMLEAYYDALSVNAHPRLRIGDAIRIDGTTVRVRSQDDVPNDTPCEIALACVRTVEALLRTHVLPELRGDAL